MNSVIVTTKLGSFFNYLEAANCKATLAIDNKQISCIYKLYSAMFDVA